MSVKFKKRLALLDKNNNCGIPSSLMMGRQEFCCCWKRTFVYLKKYLWTGNILGDFFFCTNVNYDFEHWGRNADTIDTLGGVVCAFYIQKWKRTCRKFCYEILPRVMWFSYRHCTLFLEVFCSFEDLGVKSVNWSGGKVGVEGGVLANSYFVFVFFCFTEHWSKVSFKGTSPLKTGFVQQVEEVRLNAQIFVLNLKTQVSRVTMSRTGRANHSWALWLTWCLSDPAQGLGAHITAGTRSD